MSRVNRHSNGKRQRIVKRETKVSDAREGERENEQRFEVTVEEARFYEPVSGSQTINGHVDADTQLIGPRVARTREKIRKMESGELRTARTRL